MKEITLKVYKFEELSDKAKHVAIEDYRAKGYNHTEQNYSEAKQSVAAFHAIFPTRAGSRSWLDFIITSTTDAQDELTGIRLATFIYNNYGSDLFKPKQFSLWSKTEKSFKYHKEGYPKLKVRKSKVLKDNCCVLTGVCWDEDLLKPIYDFIAKPTDGPTLEDLFTEGFETLRISLESADEYAYSDDGITERIESNDYEFLESGKIF